MPRTRNVWHEVQEDEDPPIIAAYYGIKDWALVYEDVKNEAFRKNHPNPNILYKGEKIWIPDPPARVFERETGQTHTFTLYPPTTTLQLFLRDADLRPYANIRYEVWIGDSKYGEDEKKTRADGLVFETIPLVKEVELRVWFPDLQMDEDDEEEEGPIDEGAVEINEHADPWSIDDVSGDSASDTGKEERETDPEAYESLIIKLAHLDPVDTLEGVQDRLTNLGYPCGEEQGDIGELTNRAISKFQSDYGLPLTGEIDFGKGMEDPTLKALATAYFESDGEAADGK